MPHCIISEMFLAIRLIHKIIKNVGMREMNENNILKIYQKKVRVRPI